MYDIVNVEHNKIDNGWQVTVIDGTTGRQILSGHMRTQTLIYLQTAISQALLERTARDD